ncbi:MAG: DUF350 domain-containing protein [Marinifilaceae bacterium]|jgi:uncharacterized membrane protein YjfL (UPF0719 family)
MDFILDNPRILHFVETVGYLMAAFLIFYLGKLIYQLFNPSISVKDELVEKDNFAFSLSHTGYLVGLIIVLGSAIVGSSYGFWIDLMDLGIYGLLGILLLNLSTVINDRFILRKFSVRKEIIEDRNAGTGAIEAANSVASGLIIFGAISGESGNVAFGLLTSVVFWAVGQVAMMLLAWVYDKITNYDLHDQIEKDNVAAGIAFGGAMIALANLIRFGLAGDFFSWGESFYEVGTEVLLGIVFLPVVRWLADKILLPGQSLSDEIARQDKPNVGAALIEAFAYIGGSVLITWVL